MKHSDQPHTSFPFSRLVGESLLTGKKIFVGYLGPNRIFKQDQIFYQPELAVFLPQDSRSKTAHSNPVRKHLGLVAKKIFQSDLKENPNMMGVFKSWFLTASFSTLLGSLLLLGSRFLRN